MLSNQRMSQRNDWLRCDTCRIYVISFSILVSVVLDPTHGRDQD
jgi:hypothetical protein